MQQMSLYYDPCEHLDQGKREMWDYEDAIEYYVCLNGHVLGIAPSCHCPPGTYLDQKEKPIKYSDFVNKEPILFSRMRINELKTDIDVPDDVINQFKNFWLNFKDTPLKGCCSTFLVLPNTSTSPQGGMPFCEVLCNSITLPGTGKSQFLKFAAKLCNRSVITTGLGSTSADWIPSQSRMEVTFVDLSA
ncbi:putative DNA helicase MCM9 [Camellia lanceoleosa]|uniref:DNA helicase MCM9 n=1 Tax=Camellia lanceoleosa TaxID=1840588 RepID=A0ACC0GLZ8_9ERIC|nr:putative DNA helicase MCM9 [Camellia lanceoleosa]